MAKFHVVLRSTVLLLSALGACAESEPAPLRAAAMDDVEVYSRLTKQEYRYVATDLLDGASGAAQASVARAIDALDENNYVGHFKNYSPIAVAPGVERAQLEIARTIARAFMESRLYHELCRASCPESLSAQLLPRLWKRRLSSDTVQQLIAFHQSFPPEDRDYYFLLRVFASPYFHYKIFDAVPRNEAAVAEGGAAVPETGAALPEDEAALHLKRAHLISFALAGSFPDAELWADAEKGALRTPDDWKPHIERLLDRHHHRFSNLFLPSWLGLGSAAEINQEFHGVPMRPVVAEPVLVFSEVLREQRPISALIALDSNAVNDEVAGLYGARAEGPPVGEIPGWYRPQLTSSLFGTAALSYLTVDHETLNPSPIRRGSYVLNRLLCREIDFPSSALQGEVDRVVAAAPRDASPPERMAFFRSHAACAGCHNQIDPYGLALEEIGAFGVHRTAYYTGDPVEAHGTAGDIHYSSSLDFVTLLAASKELESCFSKQVYRYVSSEEGDHRRFDELPFDEAASERRTAREIVVDMVLRSLEVSNAE
ncbi:MAG: DUF1592 domain-containing protein [Myxococcota bacterium]